MASESNRKSKKKQNSTIQRFHGVDVPAVRVFSSRALRSLISASGSDRIQGRTRTETLSMSTVLDAVENPPMVLYLRPVLEMTDDQFYEFCRLNRDWRIERNAEGEIIIMAPAGSESSSRNIHITAQLLAWAKADGYGRGFRLERWVQVGKRSDPVPRRGLGSSLSS